MSILDTLKGLFTKGKEVVDVDVNGDGQVNIADAQEAAQNIPETLGNVTEQAKTAVEDLKSKLPK